VYLWNVIPYSFVVRCTYYCSLEDVLDT